MDWEDFILVVLGVALLESYRKHRYTTYNLPHGDKLRQVHENGANAISEYMRSKYPRIPMTHPMT